METKTNKSGEQTTNKSVLRIEALKASGIDTSSYFAMETGQIARLNNNILSIVPDDDPIFDNIKKSGVIHEYHLFRRWVMAQMFHMLKGNFTENIRHKGADYQWKMIQRELYTQVVLYRNDEENFIERNRWFNRETVRDICLTYLKQLRRHINYLTENKVRKCKGNPYIRIAGRNVFITDIQSRILTPIEKEIIRINESENIADLYASFHGFKLKMVRYHGLKMDMPFIDSYKGVGAYYTMKNLILFHGCNFIDEDDKELSQSESIEYLVNKAEQYSKNFEGWRLFGVMKKLIQDNNVNIQEKIDSWRKY